ncbi:MAG TPA: D-arabinono-1,4-lactone oxidase [Devosia sp.]|nr:D-arabinono-1,4-lactone oxidase [Devosia sp.]
MTETPRNWAGNIAYSTGIETPRSRAELQDLVRRAGRLRALGSRHSFNRIADSTGAIVSLKGFERLYRLDRDARTVTVDGGTTYGDLCPRLDADGFALANLASLPHISIVGAVATATHGSGNLNRNLAAAVAALEFVTAGGDVVTLRRGDADFAGAVVGLGALGIVTAITLDVVPRFDMRQNVYVDLPFAAYVDNFDAITGSAYSVSAFTHWQGERIASVWLKSLADAPPRQGELFGARPAERPCHPIESLDPAPATEQLGVPGPWYLRLPHFRIEFSPSAGAELQSEYFVPRRDGPAALRALHAVQDRFAAPLMVSELRTVAADDLWLSSASGQDCLAVHFTWQRDWPTVQTVLPIIEQTLAPFAVRPHWGKLFTLPKADIATRWPKLEAFKALVKRYDPQGKFRNKFLDETIF